MVKIINLNLLKEHERSLCIIFTDGEPNPWETINEAYKVAEEVSLRQNCLFLAIGTGENYREAIQRILDQTKKGEEYLLCHTTETSNGFRLNPIVTSVSPISSSSIYPIGYLETGVIACLAQGNPSFGLGTLNSQKITQLSITPVGDNPEKEIAHLTLLLKSLSVAASDIDSLHDLHKLGFITQKDLEHLLIQCQNERTRRIASSEVSICQPKELDESPTIKTRQDLTDALGNLNRIREGKTPVRRINLQFETARRRRELVRKFQKEREKTEQIGPKDISEAGKEDTILGLSARPREDQPLLQTPDQTINLPITGKPKRWYRKLWDKLLRGN